jgi:3-oxoacyl-[acyl-carrier-protein] synthase II
LVDRLPVDQHPAHLAHLAYPRSIPMAKRRVVVTGLGIISPVGNSVDDAWASLMAGKSGITRINRFDPAAFSCQIAGDVKNFELAKYLSAKDARRMDTFIHFGLAAAIDAFKDSGLEVTEANRERIGVNIGSGIGGLQMIEETHKTFLADGPRKISPFFIPATIINMISGHLSIMFGLQGPNVAMVTACTTGTHSIGEAGRMIEYGEAEVMIAGGAESTICPLAIGGFAAARALSTRNADPEGASRPWDKERDGFVMGEGAGVLVLEEYEHAKARGARIYCELIGYGKSADAHHMTAPIEDGSGAARCMDVALRNAGINPDRIDYINAHGTSTPLGDLAETKAVKRSLGDHAAKVMVSSTKSMTGHLLGAAGGIEAVFSALAIARQAVPPTINLAQPDEGCDLDYVANTARDAQVNVALSNSFGFGGTNGTLIFAKL